MVVGAVPVCVQHFDGCPYLRITARRAQVLTVLMEAGSQPAAAHRLGISPDGLKRHLAELRDVAECGTTMQLVAWWIAHRGDWVVHMGHFAGLELEFQAPRIAAPARTP